MTENEDAPPDLYKKRGLFGPDVTEELRKRGLTAADAAWLISCWSPGEFTAADIESAETAPASKALFPLEDSNPRLAAALKWLFNLPLLGQRRPLP